MLKHWKALSRRTRIRIGIAGSMVALLLMADLGSVIAFGVNHPKVEGRVDAVIVLGAKVGTPALTERTLTGLKYYQAGKTPTLVLSGAQGSDEPISEAQAMADVIKERLVSRHQKMPKIILETRSLDTFQNLKNSKKLVPNAKSIVVVSDGYHLERSVAIAKHVGFQKVYWDSPKPSYYSSVDLAHYYVREAIAMIAYLPRLM